MDCLKNERNDYTNISTSKEYNIDILHKYISSNATEYQSVFEKQKHITFSCEPISVVQDPTAGIGQVIWQENLNTKNHQLLTSNLVNINCLTEDSSKQFSYLNKQNDLNYPVTGISNSPLIEDANKIMASTFQRDFHSLDSQQLVKIQRHLFLEQNIYPSSQLTSHFQEQKPVHESHNFLSYETKQINIGSHYNQHAQQVDVCTSNGFESGSTTNNHQLSSTDFYQSDNNKMLKPRSKDYKCNTCQATFAKLSLMNRHKKNVHQERSMFTTKKKKIFSCNDCSYVTKYSGALKRHKEVHSSSREYECPSCGKVFKQLFSLRTHERVHAGLKVHQCGECDFITPYPYSLKRHMLHHSGEKAFTCFVCDKKFLAAPDLKRHLRSHTGQKPYLCNLCGCLFRQTGHLKFHYRRHHPEYLEKRDGESSKASIKVKMDPNNPLGDNVKNRNMVEIKAPNSITNISGTMDEGTSPLVTKKNNCDTVNCCKATTVAAFTKSKLGCNLPLTANADDLNQVVTYIKPCKSLQVKKSFPCKICQQCFKSARSLIIHNKIHEGGKCFSCDMCNFVTLHPSSLRKHTRSHLCRKFVCFVCNASFSSEERLNTHSKVHDESKRYKCDRCQFVSSYASALNRHKLTHNVVKTFACDDCGEGFHQEFQMNTHKRLHAAKKIYKCDECAFKTPYTYSLKRHKISHSGLRPYPCTFCEAAFAGAEDLKRHIRAHLGEKPFICNICGKLFSQAAHVKNHKRKHFINPEIKKIRKCLECGESFTDLALLRQHKKVSHKPSSLIT